MSGGLYSFADFVAGTRGRPFGPEPSAVLGISIDSRTVGPGEAFFAIKGDKFDGHDFVTTAIGRGAATAVVSSDRLAAFGRVRSSLVVVEDVLGALRGLAAMARARSSARIVAVTGSAGKTGTKDMLLRVLGTAGPTHGAPASFNNHWGVPLTLARMPADASFGVFEIGMNHSGEITPLVQLVRPHAAIITTVEPVHLEAFASVEEIARAKGEILTGIEPGGAAILNRDNPFFDLLKSLALQAGVERIIGFGGHRDADARLDEVVLEPGSSIVSADILGRPVTYTVGAPGRHIVNNSLAVLAAAAVLGIDTEQAAAALANHTPGKGRGERTLLRIDGGSALLIDESYNANPASMRAALAVLHTVAPANGGERIAVLGDMLELGENEVAFHTGLAEPLAESGADRVYLAGPRMKSLWEALPPDRRAVYAETAAELESALAQDIGPGDVVMIKGSNGSRMGPLVESLKRRFAAPVPAGAEAGV